MPRTVEEIIKELEHLSVRQTVVLKELSLYLQYQERTNSRKA